MADLDLHPEDLRHTAVVLGATLTYLIYHYGLSAQRWIPRFTRPDRDPHDAHALALHVQRLGGGALLGLAALAHTWALPDLDPLFGLPRLRPAAGWLAACALILLPILATAARSPNTQARYPELRRPTWQPRHVLATAADWVIYLLGYEAFFRGPLLALAIHHTGVWPGIAWVSAIYALAHLEKDAGEAVGSLGMGLVFGAMTVSCGSFWPAWLLHCGIALTSQGLALHCNPDLRLARARR